MKKREREKLTKFALCLAPRGGDAIWMLRGDLDGFIDDAEMPVTLEGNEPGGEGVPETDDLEEEFDGGTAVSEWAFDWVLGERTNGENDGATVDCDIVERAKTIDYEIR